MSSSNDNQFDESVKAMGEIVPFQGSDEEFGDQGRIICPVCKNLDFPHLDWDQDYPQFPCKGE